MSEAAAKRTVRLAGTQRATLAQRDNWPSVSQRAICTEARFRGLGDDYDAVADDADIAAELVAALHRWRNETRSDDGSTEPPATATEPQTSVRATLTARMHCPECLGSGQFILCLPSGHVVALNGDLTYDCTSKEEAEDMSVFCCKCTHTAPARDFRGGAIVIGSAGVMAAGI